MRRRALLATAAPSRPLRSLAGCPTPLGGDSRNRRRRRGNPPPRVTVRGRLLDGSRDCYRVDLIEADLDAADRLLLRLTTQDDPDWDGGPCSDIGQTHPYDIAVEFTEAAVPERVEVRRRRRDSVRKRRCDSPIDTEIRLTGL